MKTKSIFETQKEKILGPLYLQAGAALFDCQSFEYAIALLLFHFSRLGVGGLNSNKLMAILENDDKKTLGQLIFMLRQNLKVSDGIEEALSDALSSRNNLIHRFLVDNVEKFIEEDDRQQLIKEIRQLRRKIQKADKMLRPFISAFGEAMDGFNIAEFHAEAKSRFLSANSPEK